jgi:hypothetical protein
LAWLGLCPQRRSTATLIAGDQDGPLFRTTGRTTKLYGQRSEEASLYECEKVGI